MDYLEEKRSNERINEAVKNAMLSGGVTGAIMGGVGSAFSGVKSPRTLLKDALLGAIATSGLVGGATKLGSEIMGEPKPTDIGGYTERGALGGVLGGGALGALAGGLVGSGRIPLKAPKIPMFKKAVDALPTDNILADYMRKLAAEGGKKGAMKGAAIGGGGLGTAAAFLASDEGMQLDYIMNRMQEEERRSLARRLSGV